MAIIICPGGGYGAGWKTGVVYAADYFVPKGIAVIGLKYRLRPPHRLDNAGIQTGSPCSTPSGPSEWFASMPSSGTSIPTRLASRATRRVPTWRSILPRTSTWETSSRPIPSSTKQSARFCRRAIDLALAKKKFAVRLPQGRSSGFSGPHATNDGIHGGTTIEMPKAIKADLEKLGVPVHMAIFDQGASRRRQPDPATSQERLPAREVARLVVEVAGSTPEANSVMSLSLLGCRRPWPRCRRHDASLHPSGVGKQRPITEMIIGAGASLDVDFPCDRRARGSRGVRRGSIPDGDRLG